MAKFIKSFRQKNGLTLDGLAEFLGVSLQTVHNWESEKKTPPKFLKHYFELYEDSKPVFIAKAGKASEIFEQAWLEYPSVKPKGNKVEAKKRFLTLAKSGKIPENFIDKVKEYRKFCDEGHYNAHMTTWLGKAGYLNDWLEQSAPQGSQQAVVDWTKYPEKFQRLHKIGGLTAFEIDKWIAPIPSTRKESGIKAVLSPQTNFEYTWINANYEQAIKNSWIGWDGIETVEIVKP